MKDFLAIYNPTEDEITTTIHGSFFTLKPGQVKQVRAAMADFVDMNRKQTGLMKVEDPRFIPAEQDHYIPNFASTPEGQEVLAPLKEKGINNLITHLMEVIRNNQVSLRQDLANKYPTADSGKLAAAYASPAELEAMRMVVKYKKKTSENAARQIEEVENLMKQVGPMIV